MAVPMVRFRRSGQISVRKIAMPRLMGTPMSMAMSRGDDRPVDRRQRTELLGDRVPFLGDQEVEAESAPGWQRAMHQSGDDAGEQREHRDRRDLRDCLEERGRRCGSGARSWRVVRRRGPAKTLSPRWPRPSSSTSLPYGGSASGHKEENRSGHVRPYSRPNALSSWRRRACQPSP